MHRHRIPAAPHLSVALVGFVAMLGPSRDLDAQAPAPGALVQDPRLRLSFPDGADHAIFQPFVDTAGGGGPRAVAVQAAGAGDFDGDANAETWYLATDGSLSVMMPQTADLGRFLPYARLTDTGIRDAANWSAVGDTVRRLVAVRPDSPALWCFDYDTLPGQGPREGVFTLAPTGFIIGTGAVEVATFDADGDGNDSVVVLREIRDVATQAVIGAQIDCLEFVTDPVVGWTLQRTWSVHLPMPCNTLRAGDLDADGRVDWAVNAAGFGVLAIGEGTVPGLPDLLGAVQLGGLPLREIAYEDTDADGSDELLLTLDAGALWIDDLGNYGACVAPTGLGALGGSALLDADGDGVRDLVLIPRDVARLVVFPFDALGMTHRAPWEIACDGNSDAFAAGGSSIGLAAHTADIDADGDRDLLLQAPRDGSWLTLRGTTTDLSPVRVQIDPTGPLAPSGFMRHEITIDVPATMLAGGVTELEVATLLRDPVTDEFGYWSRSIVTVDPLTRRVVVPLEVMMDVVNVPWLRNVGLTHWAGALTAGGDTVMTIHPKAGSRRHQSVVVTWDGDQGPNGSVVGVRWRVIAAPPLPTSDAELLPWD